MAKIRNLTAILIISLFTFSVSAQPQTGSQELQEVTKIFDDFLNTWLVQQDIDKAIKYFDGSKLDNNTRKIFSIYDPAFNSDIWLRKVLTMWLTNDHEQVEAYGHGEPNDPGYIKLPLSPTGLSGVVR